MEHFLKFSKRLSNIIQSLNLVVLQTGYGESATPVKWKFFKRSGVWQLLLITYQVTEYLAKMQNADISIVTKFVPLETLYKSDSNIDALPAILKVLRKTHQKNLWWGQFSVDSCRVEISNCLKGTLLKTLFQNFPKTFQTTNFLNILWEMYKTIFSEACRCNIVILLL